MRLPEVNVQTVCGELVAMRRVPEVNVCVVACWIMAASTVNSNSRHKRQKCSEKLPLQDREIIKPSITELTKEVRTNILCTVEGCGKILPNTPALNMHLVKSHRIKVQHYIITMLNLLFNVFTSVLLHFTGWVLFHFYLDSFTVHYVTLCLYNIYFFWFWLMRISLKHFILL